MNLDAKSNSRSLNLRDAQCVEDRSLKRKSVISGTNSKSIQKLRIKLTIETLPRIHSALLDNIMTFSSNMQLCLNREVYE